MFDADERSSGELGLDLAMGCTKDDTQTDIR